VKHPLFRQCITYPRHRQLGRGYHKFVLQPKNPKPLFSQPNITVLVGKALLLGFVAWTVNFDNQSMFEADEIKDIIAQGNLPLKLGTAASAVANCAPNKGLGLNGSRALVARETAEEGSRDFFWHGGHDTRHSSPVERTRLSRVARPPHPSLLRNDTFPREGGRNARGLNTGAKGSIRRNWSTSYTRSGIST
jgi:hypothetical protein